MNIDWNSVREVAHLVADVAVLIVVVWQWSTIKRLTTLEKAERKRKMVEDPFAGCIPSKSPDDQVSWESRQAGGER